MLIYANAARDTEFTYAFYIRGLHDGVKVYKASYLLSNNLFISECKQFINQ